MMLTTCVLLLFILQLPDLVTAPLPLRHVKGYEDIPTKTLRSPYSHPALTINKESNEIILSPLNSTLKRDENMTASPEPTVPLPPFLHPHLRTKRDVNEIVKPILPLPPNLHPMLRVKRGTDDEDEDCSKVVDPSKADQSGRCPTDQEEEEDEDKCYYHRLRKTNDETVKRPTHSQVKGCGGELRRMSELFDDDDTNLYGAPNKPAVIIARGGGEYIDWTDANKVTEIGRRKICRNHERELGSDWEGRYWNHYKRKEIGKRTRPVCSMPDSFFQHPHPMTLRDEVYRIESQEAEAILKKKGVLLHPGLPICAAHEREARDVQAQIGVEKKGHVIRPPPIGGDFSQTPAITTDVNPMCDPRDENDPTYQPSHPKHPEPPMGDETFITDTDREKRAAYIKFMNAIGVRPNIAHKNWHNVGERQIRRQQGALKHAVVEIATQMNRENPQALIEKTCKTSSDYERARSPDYVQMMENLKEALDSVDSRADRLAFLSMFSRLGLKEIRRHVPGLTGYLWNQARRYAKRGYYIEIEDGRRIKYSFAKVERFIEFLTSYKVTIGLPYGRRRVRDSQKKWVEIPNTLRKLRSGEIYHLYKKELIDAGEELLLIPESTARKMIHICSAEKRKSLHGVDVTIADAMEAFDNAEEMIDTLFDKAEIDKSWHKTLRNEMLQGRQYLRTDYLSHAKEAAYVGDHCWSFGLSDPDEPAFQKDCSNSVEKHAHSQKLEKKYEKQPLKLQEIAVLRRDYHDWEDKIVKLKAHQLRTAKSEDDRQYIIADLMDGDVLMTVDFAMKHMPLRGREATTDWYGQRGMPWHVTHVATYKGGEYYQHTLVHILQKEGRQDSATVTAIIRHSLQQLKSKGIQRVFLRSDQAGAYKSSSTLASIRSIANEVGINVVGWYFSEAQAGKGPCDRSAATTKMITRDWADAGGRVTSPLEFYEAVTRSRLRVGRSYYLVKVEGKGGKKPKLSSTKINDLSKLNAFTFEKNHLRVWRFWNIGWGKEISYKGMIPNDARLNVYYSRGALADSVFWMKLGDPDHPEEPANGEMEDQGEEEEEQQEEEQCEEKEKEKDDKKCKKPKPVSKLFRCPIETCSKEFITEKWLEKHMTVGKHLKRPEKMNVLDFALHRFGVKLETDAAPRMCNIVDNTIDSLAANTQNGRKKKMGWALPTRRRSTRFPKEVKDFLKKLYDEGAASGVKTDAHEAEKLMRKAKNDDGTLLFQPEHLLNSRQIAGVYTGFKTTKLDKRDRIRSDDDPEPDEVNDLFDMEGDPELEYETEPLFDEQDLMRQTIEDHFNDLFDGEADHDQELMERGIEKVHSFRGWLGGYYRMFY